MDRLMQRDPEVLPLENKRKHYAFWCQFMRSQVLCRAAQYCLLLLYHKCGTCQAGCLVFRSGNIDAKELFACLEAA